MGIRRFQIANLLQSYGFPQPTDGAFRIDKYKEGFWFTDKDGNQRYVGYTPDGEFVDFTRDGE